MNGKNMMEGLQYIGDDLIAMAGDFSIQKKRGFRTSRAAIAAAAAAISLLLVGSAAAYALYSGAMLQMIFGTNGRQSYEADFVCRMYEPGGSRTEWSPELAEKYVVPHVRTAEGSITDGDRCLSVLSYIVDRGSCTAAVYLKLENPPEYRIANSGWLTFDDSEEMGIRSGWYVHWRADGQHAAIGRCIADAQNTDDKTLYFTLFFSCEPVCRELILSMGNGTETISLPLPEETGMPEVTFGEGKITVTPFGMRLRRGLYQNTEPADERKNVRYVKLNPVEVKLLYADGEEYLLMRTNTLEDDYVGYTYGMALNLDMEENVYVFNRVVDVTQITAVQIGETVYPCDRG